MCAMALMHARFKRVVFAASDPKTGAAGSVTNLFAEARLNHHTALLGGVMAEPAAALLRRFFADRRAQQRAERDAPRAMGGTWGHAGAGNAGEADAEAGSATSATVDGPPVDEADQPIPAGESTELPHGFVPPETP